MPAVRLEAPKPFSAQLNDWLQGKEPKTLQNLSKVAGDKSFALIFLVLMALPALPIPTGGLTHIFEIITMLLALELIIGRQTIWLPERWQKLTLSHNLTQTGLPKLIGVIRWIEKYSRPRFSDTLNKKTTRQLIGLMVLIFTIFSFVAPPFSGLDTLPAAGVVALSLGIILDDIVLIGLGAAVGVAGATLDIFLGRAIFDILKLNR